MTCEENLKIKTKLIKEVIKDLELDYSLDYILENFKSIVIAIEEKRTRLAAVVKVDDKKTKRLYIKTVTYKNKNDKEKTREVVKCSIFVSLYRSIKLLKELRELENGLTLNNTQLLYNDLGYYKELGTTMDPPRW